MARVVALGDCASVCSLLEERGDEVLRAPAQAQAVSLLRELVPELILVGKGASIAARLVLLGKIRSEPTLELIPRLALERESTPQIVASLLDAGAHAVAQPDQDGVLLTAQIDALIRLRAAVIRQIDEAQRATLVELAGAVAHRINQPLTSMSVIVETLAAQQLRDELGPDRLSQRLRELHRLVDRMAQIVRQVANLDEYRTTPYIGAVKIIDLGGESRRSRKSEF